jgi:EmrB/QacA subfamily drug resistance transporter
VTAAPGRAAAGPWLAFSAVAVGNFMATLDGSIVNVALPTLGGALGAPIEHLEWIVSGYLLVISASLLAMGRLGDVLGHRAVYVGGLVAFTAGSALCGAAGSLGGLVAARVVQGVGASAMMALGPAIVTAVFPPGLRGRALGAIGSVVALGLVTGPPVGGAILLSLSWRWVFFVNLPVGVLGVAWALRILPRGRGAPGERFDALGAILLAAALSAGLLAIDAASAGAGGATGLAAVAAAAWGGLALRARRVATPIVDASAFRDRAFAAGIAAGLLSYAAMFSQTFLTPFYLARVLGLGPGALGLMLGAVPAALAVASPLAGWIADRFRARGLGAAGMALLAAGLASLSVAGPSDGLGSVALRLAACGFGMGLFQAPNNAEVMGAAPRGRLGSGGGLLATARNVGMAIGVALSGTLLAWRAGPDPDPSAFLDGYALALRAGAAIALAAGVTSLVHRAGGRARRPPAPRPDGSGAGERRGG